MPLATLKLPELAPPDQRTLDRATVEFALMRRRAETNPAAQLGAEQWAMVGRMMRLDLEPIVFKLTQGEGGKPGLALDQADRRELRYRRFMILVGLYPDHHIVPDEEVDEFWHAHQGDTAKYLGDCWGVFGTIIFHYPYFGLRGPEDAVKLQTSFDHTGTLYQLHWGEELSLTDGGGSGSGTCNMCEARVSSCNAGYCDATAQAGLPRPRPDRILAA